MTKQEPSPVTISIDAQSETGPLDRIWRCIGYNEINWTYTPIGRQVLQAMQELGDGSFCVRVMGSFSSGNRRSYAGWGTTNCYTEDADGRAHYDWSITDRLYDSLVEYGCKPMVVLGFMPHDLSAHSETGLFHSWRYPPKDYQRWQELNFRFVEHLLERYGKEEIRTWYFAPWNEPDERMGFSCDPDEARDTPQRRQEEYLKLFDYAVAGVRAADENLRVGGPECDKSTEFLEFFLEQCKHGIDHVTGKKGRRLDFVSMHGKGTGIQPVQLGPSGPSVQPGACVPMPDFDLLVRRRILAYDKVLRKYPEFHSLPWICNEWDIDFGTIYGIHDSPDYSFRDTSYYPVFLIRMIKEMLDLKQRLGINLTHIGTWAFFFHGSRCFEGHRALFDPMGIRKPVFNGFEMLSRLGEKRLVAATDDAEVDVSAGEEAGIEGGRCPTESETLDDLPQEQRILSRPQVDVLAARDADCVQALVWSQVYRCDAIGDRTVDVIIRGLEDWERVRISHYRIDECHSNAHTVWEELECPDWPTDEQVATMRSREGLEKCEADRELTPDGGRVSIQTVLPMHSVSLLLVNRCSE